MRGWGKGISSSSHCCEVFTIHRQDVSQTATVAVIVEITLCVYVLLDITAAGKSVFSVVAQNHNISQLISYQSMSFFSQTGSNKHSVRCRTSAASTSATAPPFVVVVLNSGLFVSVSVGCLMQLCVCDGWLQCFSNREWGPGLFPVGIHMGGYVWVILRFRDLHVGNWTPESGSAMFCRFSYMPQLYFCLWQREKHICFTDQQRTRNKREPNANPDTQQNLCATVFSLETFVFHHCEIFAQTAPKKTVFLLLQ